MVSVQVGVAIYILGFSQNTDFTESDLEKATQGTTQTNECVGVSEERYGNVPQDVPQYQLDEQILEALQKDNKISTEKLR